MPLTLEVTPTSMDNLGTAFEFVTDKMSSMVSVVLSQPIFLLPVGIFVAGAAIGLCGRLIGR